MKKIYKCGKCGTSKVGCSCLKYGQKSKKIKQKPKKKSWMKTIFEFK